MSIIKLQFGSCPRQEQCSAISFSLSRVQQIYKDLFSWRYLIEKQIAPRKEVREQYKAYVKVRTKSDITTYIGNCY